MRLRAHGLRGFSACVKALLVASCLACIAVLSSCGGSGDAGKPVDMSKLPPHVLADVVTQDTRSSPTVLLYIVVPADTTESEARIIAAAYKKQFSTAGFLSIDFFCDSTHAKYDPNILDSVYSAHELYGVEYRRGQSDLWLSWLKDDTLGTACHPRKGT